MAIANEQAWKDFDDIVNQISGIKQVIKNINTQIETLKGLKEEILDDPARKAELKKIIDIYPDYTITTLTAEYTKLMALKTWLESNTYLL